MKKNNRRLLYSFILLVMASVFFIACGQPTYRTLSNISIKSSTISTGINFYFSGSDSDLPYVKDGPGLLLAYVTTDSPSLTDRNSIISQFSKTFGSGSELGKNVVRPEAGKSIIEDHNLFAFSVNRNQVSAWKYHYDLTGRGTEISDNFLITQKNGAVILENLINHTETVLLTTDGVNFEKGQYVHLFSAFTCQGTTNNIFSNIYWSNLYYLGNLRIEY